MEAAAQPFKPRWRGRIHQFAFFVAVPAGAALVVLAEGPLARTVAAVYAVSLVAMFGASAAYHRVAWSPSAFRRMKRLDHSMIYVLIAGSYTPVSLLVLEGVWSVVIFSVVWAGAAAGITLKLVRIEGLSVVAGVLYMSLGWIALVVLPQIVRGLSAPATLLMFAGGVLYTAGAIVLARKRPDPRPAAFGFHEIWHAFMVTAAACHYGMILLILRASA